MAFLPGDSVWCVCVCVMYRQFWSTADCRWSVCVCVCVCACVHACVRACVRALRCIPLLIDCRLAVLYADEELSSAELPRNAAFHATNTHTHTHTHTCSYTQTHILKTHKYSHMQHQAALGALDYKLLLIWSRTAWHLQSSCPFKPHSTVFLTSLAVKIYLNKTRLLGADCIRYEYDLFCTCVFLVLSVIKSNLTKFR